MQCADSAPGPAGCLALMALPAEVLEQIWLCSQLDYCDICRLAMTCSKFQTVSSGNEVWRAKLDKRWPDLLSQYPPHDHPAWKDEFRKRAQIGRITNTLISGMSQLFIHKEEVPRSAFEDLGNMEDPRNAHLVIDALMELYHDTDSHKNLTEKYYAEKALCHVRQLHIHGEWKRFLEQPLQKQHLEKGAVLIAQWGQPTQNIAESRVAHTLDTIASRVLAEVARRHPEHPVLKKVPDRLLAAELTASAWPPKQSRKILQCLNHVLFSDMNFMGNVDDYYDPLNSYINTVLINKKGIPISMCLVYASIARRLYVVCEPVSFPAHFLLRWLERPGQGDGQDYTYIDVFHWGKFMTEYECSNLSSDPLLDTVLHSNCEAIPPIKVFERMARNLVNLGRRQGQMGDGVRSLRTSVELLLIFCPGEVDTRILQARLYLHMNINLREVIDILQDLTVADTQQNAPAGLIRYLLLTAQQQFAAESNEPAIKEIVAKRRGEVPEVELSVGLIMKHKRYNYTCVVYGWDVECEATQEWIWQMGVNNLPKQMHQPFYNVLVEDGSNRYAAQENLELALEPKEITHPEVGRYFREFRGTHYVPNAEKLSQYPEDQDATFRFITDNYS